MLVNRLWQWRRGAVALLLLVGGCGGSSHEVVDLSAVPDLASTDLGSTDSATAPLVVSLTVSLNNIGGASGKVTSTSVPDGNQIDCGSTCSVTRDNHTELTLSATPASGYYFGGWSGDCVGPSSTCTVSLTQPRTVQASFTPANLAFITSQAYTIDQVKAASTATGAPTETQKMLSGADALCRGAGGSNDFYAWLATDEENAASRLPPAARGFVRKDGLQFKDVITGPASFYPIRLDQNGHVPTERLIYTGAGVDGAGSGTAGDWAGVGNYLSSGLATGIGDDWTSYAGGNYNAGDSELLLCLETRYSAVVTLPPAPAGARFMFASKPISIGGGIGGFDAVCATEAAIKHLPGSYKALVAANGASAASRFVTRDVPIYRTDGAIVANSDTVLLSATGTPDAPIAIGVDAQVAPKGTFYLAWVGGSNPTVAAASNCSDAVQGDWYSTSGSGSQGDLFDAPSWFSGFFFPCDGSYSVYCLQE